MGTAVLSARDLDVGFGNAVLLRGLSLSIDAGGLDAVTGPSGCGKTTLLRTLAGLVDPLAGEMAGEALMDARDGARASITMPWQRRRVVYVQQHAVMLDGSVQANLARPFGYRSALGSAHKTTEAADPGWPHERAMAMLGALGVEASHMHAAAKQLSVGQRQRVALVRALLIKPVVLLLDEPTAGLDEAAARAVWRLLRDEVQERGLAVLVASHDVAARDVVACGAAGHEAASDSAVRSNGRFDRVTDLSPYVVASVRRETADE